MCKIFNLIKDVFFIPRLPGAREFSLAEIAAAKEYFKIVIGRGGFGDVYHGKLEDGSQVAVKQGHRQSEQGVHEFETEIATMSKLRRRPPCFADRVLRGG